MTSLTGDGERPDDLTIKRDDAIQSLDELVAYVEEPITLPTISDDLTCERAQDIRDLLEEYSDIFAQLPSDGSTMEPFAIELVDEKKRIKIGPRPLSQRLQAAADKCVDDLLRLNIVEEAEASEWSSPILMVPKTTSEWRLCIDYINAERRHQGQRVPHAVDLRPHPAPGAQAVLCCFRLDFRVPSAQG